MKTRRGFIERTVRDLHSAMEHALYAEDVAHMRGVLQLLDARVKVAGLISLIVAAALAKRLSVVLAIFGLAIVLAALSKVSIRSLATKAWIGAFAFTGFIALPAIFITPGLTLFRLPVLHWPVSLPGLRTAAYLIARVETAATLSLLLILTTPWSHVLKALRVLRVPVAFVAILSMTCRYIFLMLQIARDMFESRQSRIVGRLDGAERRRMASSVAGVLLGKTMQLSEDVYLAMQARGFRGEFYILDEFQFRSRDWLALAAFIAMTGTAFWAGR